MGAAVGGPERRRRDMMACNASFVLFVGGGDAIVGETDVGRMSSAMMSSIIRALAPARAVSLVLLLSLLHTTCKVSTTRPPTSTNANPNVLVVFNFRFFYSSVKISITSHEYYLHEIRKKEKSNSRITS